MIPHARDAEMLQHIQAWQISGETQTNYCKRHGIPTHQFTYYKHKLGYMQSGKHQNPATNQLVPVKLTPESVPNKKLWIEHHSGFKIQYHTEMNEQLLLQALMLVKQVA